MGRVIYDLELRLIAASLYDGGLGRAAEAGKARASILAAAARS